MAFGIGRRMQGWDFRKREGQCGLSPGEFSHLTDLKALFGNRAGEKPLIFLYRSASDGGSLGKEPDLTVGKDVGMECVLHSPRSWVGNLFKKTKGIWIGPPTVFHTVVKISSIETHSSFIQAETRKAESEIIKSVAVKY